MKTTLKVGAGKPLEGILNRKYFPNGCVHNSSFKPFCT